MSKVEDKLKQMGITLPPPPPPGGNYVPIVRTGNLIFLAGVTSKKARRLAIRRQVRQRPDRRARLPSRQKLRPRPPG